MAETRFIKTVTFGGYDKADVDKRLDYLYTQVCDLKNELRETKLTLEEYKKGTDEEKAHETVLSTERAKLTALQVQNETMSKKLKETTDANSNKEKEIAALTDTLGKVTKELEDARSRITALEAGGDAVALSNVFIEAQKSANMLITDSKKQSDEILENANTVVDNMIIDANNKAAQIIYEAKKNAAELDAKSKNDAEQMKVASGNVKAVMLKEIQEISAEVAKVRAVFEEFEKSGLDKLSKSEKLLSQTENKLTNGGVPVFRNPEMIEPELPEAPELKQTASEKRKKEKESQNNELDSLLAMASALDGTKAADDKPADDNKNNSKSGDLDLDALLKAAESL